MATRYGYQLAKWLGERGWETIPLPPEEVYGDPLVKDPVSGMPLAPYAAAKVHQERTGEFPDFVPKEYLI